MKNKTCKKFLAGMLATVMVMGMSLTASAAQTSVESTGTGSFEGHVEQKTISVTLPTIPAGTYSYILDPEDLITSTTNAAYAGKTFSGDKGVYFLESANTYKNTSAKMTAVNKSSVDMDIKVTASIEENENITMSATDSFTSKDAELYLAVTDGTTTKPITTTATTLTVKSAGKPENFEVKYDGGTYKWGEKGSATGWTETQIWLTGAANKNGDWSKTGLAASDVTITWSFEEHKELVFSAGTATGSVVYDTAKVQSVTSIMLPYQSYGSFDAMTAVPGTYAAASSAADTPASGKTTITFDSAFSGFFTGDVVATITYVDAQGATQAEELTLNMTP